MSNILHILSNEPNTAPKFHKSTPSLMKKFNTIVAACSIEMCSESFSTLQKSGRVEVQFVSDPLTFRFGVFLCRKQLWVQLNGRLWTSPVPSPVVHFCRVKEMQWRKEGWAESGGGELEREGSVGKKTNTGLQSTACKQ